MKPIQWMVVGCWIGVLCACGQPDGSRSHPQPSRIVETIPPQGDMHGVRIRNIYPEPPVGTIEQYSVTVGPDQDPILTPYPTPAGPDYLQADDHVTILVDHYWRRHRGDVVPVTITQQIITQQVAYPDLYAIRPIYHEDELEVLAADPQTTTWTFKAKKTGPITLRMQKTFLCGGAPCSDMPISTIGIELMVVPEP